MKNRILLALSGALLFLGVASLAAPALVRPEVLVGPVEVLSTPAPAPWVVTGPTYGSDAVGLFVEYGWTLGDATNSIPGYGPASYPIPPFDPGLGTLVAVWGDAEIDSLWNPGGEADIDATYPYPGAELNVAASWNPAAHGGRWFPDLNEIGTAGDSFWVATYSYAGVLLDTTEDRAPVAICLADDGAKPRSLFDGVDDCAGTSGGSDLSPGISTRALRSRSLRLTSTADPTIDFEFEALSSMVFNTVGRTHARSLGSATLSGTHRYYYQ